MTDHLEPPNTVADMTQPPRELAELEARVNRQGKEIARCGDKIKEIEGRIDNLNETIERRNERF